MSQISFSLPQEEIDKMRARLNTQQLHQAIYRTVKNTTHKMTRIIADHIRLSSQVSIKEVEKVITEKLEGMDGSVPPVGTVTITKHGIMLIGFKSHASKRGGVTVEEIRGQPALVLRHAFKVRLKSGHVGIFLRVRKSEIFKYQQSLLERRQKDAAANAMYGQYPLGPGGAPGSKGMPIGARRRGSWDFMPRGRAGSAFVGRFPIMEDIGPSAYHIASIPNLLKSIVFDSRQFMMKQAESQIRRFTKGQRILEGTEIDL